jgi:hypothetical protein
VLNKQLKRNVNALDVRISKLYEELDKATTNGEREVLLDRAKELADLRNKLSEVKTRESLTPIVVPGVIGLSAILLVLNYEKTGIVTSKAFGIATKMFRGL